MLCDTGLTGTVITSAGKRAAKRDYEDTFDECLWECDAFDQATCPGAAIDSHYCQAIDGITGTYAVAGGITGIRQYGGEAVG